jgi:hypothetical protein
VLYLFFKQKIFRHLKGLLEIGNFSRIIFWINSTCSFGEIFKDELTHTGLVDPGESNSHIFDVLAQEYEDEFSPTSGKKKNQNRKYSIDVD